MVLAGIFSAGIYVCAAAIRNNIDYIEAIIFLLTASAGAILGSHILYVIINSNQISNITPFKDAAYLFFNGSIFYGGLLGACLIVYIFRKYFNNIQTIIAIVTPALPLFHFFGRLGCFMYGCCFGVESYLGFEFHASPIELANGVKRLPIQLIESVFNIVLFILLHKLRKLTPLHNILFFIYLLLYSTGRFIIEYFRGDVYRGIWLFNLSTSQIISIFIFFTAVCCIAARKR